MLRFMESQRVGQDRVTRLNSTEPGSERLEKSRGPLISRPWGSQLHPAFLQYLYYEQQHPQPSCLRASGLFWGEKSDEVRSKETPALARVFWHLPL